MFIRRRYLHYLPRVIYRADWSVTWTCVVLCEQRVSLWVSPSPPRPRAVWLSAPHESKVRESKGLDRPTALWIGEPTPFFSGYFFIWKVNYSNYGVCLCPSHQSDNSWSFGCNHESFRLCLWHMCADRCCVFVGKPQSRHESSCLLGFLTHWIFCRHRHLTVFCFVYLLWHVGCVSPLHLYLGPIRIVCALQYWTCD